MWKKHLVMNLSRAADMSFADQLKLLKATGFDGFFVIWGKDLNLTELMEQAQAADISIQSIHAPWDKAADMWHGSEEKANAGILELRTCIDACVQCGAPILVVHAIVGFDKHTPTQIGLSRFAQAVDYAAEKGIQIAFENTEGEEYLEALMDYFADNDAVGFCWDSGHELCYNHSQDLLAKYGSRLLGTHLNDNLGIKAYDGTITWLDDLHLLPFDGIVDWDDVVKRLHRWGFQGPLTFELNLKSKPGRHENDLYCEMPYARYVAEAYKRACRIAAMLIAAEN